MALEAPRTDYLARNISSTCNSAGSALWASTKNIKPLIDANCHAEAIELANDRSRIQFSPIFYDNPESNSGRPGSETILFGWGPELRTDGQQNKIPLILEYLLHQFTRGSSVVSGFPVSQGTDIKTKNSPHGRYASVGLWCMRLSKHGQVKRNWIGRYCPSMMLSHIAVSST